MARPIKKGLDYYPLDVNFLQDIKVRKIMRACGIQSITILISLLSSIYRDEGYYVVWDNDMSFLVADEVGASEGAVLEIVKKAVQVDFFNEDIFDKYKILTSKGIQKRFLEAISRRKSIELIGEYLLIDLVNDYTNLVNVNINSIDGNRSTQSKAKESKVKESKEEEIKEIVDSNFKKLLSTFEQNGFGTISSYISERLISLSDDYTSEWVLKAIQRAVDRNVRTLDYVEGILKSWKAKGIDKLGGEESGANGNKLKSNTEKTYGFTEEDAERAGVTSL